MSTFYRCPKCGRLLLTDANGNTTDCTSECIGKESA